MINQEMRTLELTRIEMCDIRRALIAQLEAQDNQMNS